MTWKILSQEQADSNASSLLTEALASDPAATSAYQILIQHGGYVYVVGGAVRDAYIGKAPKDTDLLVTGLTPQAVEASLHMLPGQTKVVGENFGVFLYTDPEGGSVEIALPRTENSTGLGHTDFEVNVDPDLPVGADLERRDFTANAMAYDITKDEFIDPYGGRSDIDDGTLRLVNPDAFQDDPLRLARAIVAYANHGLQPDLATMLAMKQEARRLKHLPGERLKDELDKLLSADWPGDALLLAHETGVLAYWLPEVDVCFGYDQNNLHHALDLGSHLVGVLNNVAHRTSDVDLRLAALLHDIGKPDSEWQDENGQSHYYEHPDHPTSGNHEIVGAGKADELMQRLRYSNGRRERVVDLIKHHMFPAFATPKGARKFLNKVGPHAHDLLTLREGDQEGKGPGREADVSRMRDLVSGAQEMKAPTELGRLALNGSDLIELGIPQGPEIGRILHELLDYVIDNPDLNNRDALLALAARLR